MGRPVRLLTVSAAVAWAMSAVAGAAVDLGAVGETCPPSSSAGLPGGTSVALPAPKTVRVMIAVDVACPATSRALEALRLFRRTHPEAQVVLLLADPAGFRGLSGARLADVLDTGGVPYTWNPGYLRAMAPRALPWIRIDTPSGRTVVAAGSPDLNAMLDRAR